jgi:hypothetical protein
VTAWGDAWRKGQEALRIFDFRLEIVDFKAMGLPPLLRRLPWFTTEPRPPSVICYQPSATDCESYGSRSRGLLGFVSSQLLDDADLVAGEPRAVQRST